MASDLDRALEKLAEARARLDQHLDEANAHVPTRDDVTTVVTRYAGAAAGAALGIGVIAFIVRSKLDKRRFRSQGRQYAKALVKALPEVVNAVGGPAVEAAAIQAVGSREAASREADGGRAIPVTAVLLVAGLAGGLAASRVVGGR